MERRSGVRGTGDHKPAACCTYCDRPFDHNVKGLHQTKDHVVPRAVKLFGPDEGRRGRANKVYACQRCNLTKGKKLPHELRAEAIALEDHAALLHQIADRAEAIIKERNLL